MPSNNRGTVHETASRRFSRSGQMVNCLRQELLYSEKRARDTLFAAIERLLAQRPDAMIVTRLIRDASELAQQEARLVGYDFTHWSTAAKAVVKALLCSESLLAPNGDPIRFDVTAHAASVRSLRDDYLDRTEAFLLEVLLRRIGDVTLRDHTALAHALFRQFDPNVSMHELEDRVAILAARLADRVVLQGDRYVVLDTGQTAQQPLPADTAVPRR
jgi:hypothetical protein